MKRAIVVILLLSAGILGGCLGDDENLEPSDDPNSVSDPDVDGEETSSLTTLRFVEEDRPPVEENYTVVVEPQEPLLPGAPVYMLTGGDPSFLKIIDLSDLLPPGTHAYVDATATWEPTTPVYILEPMNLQWFSWDLWRSAEVRETEPGEAQLSGFVTNHGPDPANMILVALQPERLQESVEVDIHVRIEYLDDAVHQTHIVAAGLGGGAVPITVHLGDEDDEVTLQVRDAQAEPVLEANLGHNETVRLPAGTPEGDYLFTFFGNDDPARLLVGQANLTSDLMWLVDNSFNLGDPQEMPVQEEVTWTVELDAPPFWVGILFDGLDGRSTLIDVNVTVTAPDGTKIIEGQMTGLCLYGLSSAGSYIAHPALTAGEYTFTVRSGITQGCEMMEVLSLYGT